MSQKMRGQNRRNRQKNGDKNNSPRIDRRELLKKNMRWSRLVELIINFMSIIIMVMAAAFAVAREISWPFVIIVALECPLWVILAKKFFWEDKPFIAWGVRGALLIIGYVLLSVSVQKCVYNRCHMSVTRQNIQKEFEDKIKDDSMEYQDMGEVSKEIRGDYTELTAVVSYKNLSDSSTGNQEVTLIFDRLNGRYYESVEDMESYRQQIKDMGLNVGGHKN